MNTALWILQVILAGAFGSAGLMKLLRTREQLRERTPYVEDFSDGTIRLIGTLEVLGAIGLILPAATGILPWLTPVAAVGLVVLMALAAAVHLRRGEKQMVPVNVVLLVLALVVAWGRFGPYAL